MEPASVATLTLPRRHERSATIAPLVSKERARRTLRDLGADALALEHLDERRSIEAQQRRRAVLVPARSLERLTDQVVLERLHRRAQIDPGLGEPLRPARLRREAAHARRKIFGLDLRPFGEEHGALDRVLELAHVAGPRVVDEHLERRLRETDEVG